ncbi:MAG: hypothetical protein KC996_01510 [Phycisphaerales bacterium]|nr:hypothetical protein [Phycisphaerales bacterium]
MRRTLLSITVALASLRLLPASALGQPAGSLEYPAEITGSWYVVLSEEAVMRAGDEEVFYAVSRFPRGSMLVASSTTDRYAAVCYPLSLGALVPVGEVERVDAEHVRLTEESKLRAASSLLGMSGSWKGLYELPLLAGTELEVMEELKSDTGQVVGYRVAPPHPPVASAFPVGYVKMSDLRPATPGEVQKFLGKPAPKAAPERTNLPPQPVEKIETIEGLADPVGASEDAGSEEIDTSLLDDIEIPEPTIHTGIQPAAEPSEDPAIEEPKPDEPVIINNTEIIPDKSAPPSQKPILSVSALETLEASFDDARRLPREELDNALEELLAEYTRAYDAAGDDESLATALSQRMEWLKIRMETRDQRRAIAQTLHTADENQIAIQQGIEKWQSGRAYILVGKMVPSAVYTGERLPLLYRVQGNDPYTGEQTTIGYVAPGSDQDYRHLLGRVVGVVGASELDSALNLRIIRPSRIDAMPQN